MSQVLVFVGSGGVGKTTLAAAAGLQAAMDGKKVLVLTIDPSKRLATTLGIEGTSEPTKVPGFTGKGELWASIVDHQKTFDEFVRKAADRSAGVEKLLKNRLYRQLTTTLSGSQDFSALERLYSSHKDGGFDLVILDTPPAQHAMEFLQAPSKIAALFNEGISRWFRDAGEVGLLQKVLSAGTRQVLKVLESLTGSEFIKELGEFFRQIEGWQSRLQERTTAVHRLLVSEETKFCLVTGFDDAKLKEAEQFAREIRKGGYRLSWVVINRAFPDWMDPSVADSTPDPQLQKLFEQFAHYYRQRAKATTEFQNRLKGEAAVLRLPELADRVYDLKGLGKMADVLKTGGWS